MKCVLLFTVLVAACDPIGDATIDITIPAAVQTQTPAALHVRIGEDAGSDQLFALCAPQGDIVTTFDIGQTVCPTRQRTQIWLAPLATKPTECTVPQMVCRTNDDPSCPRPTRSTDEAPPAGAPYGEVVLFDRDGCSDHDEAHDVTLQ